MTYKLTFSVHKSDADTANTLLEEMLEATAISISEIDKQKDHWKLEAYFEERPDETAANNILDTLPYTSRQKANSVSIEKLPDVDWVSKVQSNLSPVYVGNMVIHGSHDTEKLRSHPLSIEIDAGQAFGTAHHGTTKGCMLAIQQVLKKRYYRNILDLGTGSGILAIAIAKLQKNSLITASDIDLISTVVAKENCFNNNVGNIVNTLHAESLKHSNIQQKMPFDLVVANILAGPLITLAPQLARATKDGGTLILSGLLEKQSRSVIAAYRNVGFTLEWRIPLDGWMTLILNK